MNEDFQSIQLSQGEIRYRDFGSGEPILFVHGLLVNGDLWRKVAPPLSKNFRCIVPDWPLGSHSLPMKPDADVSVLGVAKLISEFIAALGLESVTLVGNDTGGAICQIVTADFPERVGRLVLTNCDAFDNFLPPAFRYLQWGAHVPGFVFLATQTLRSMTLRNLPTAYGALTKRPLERKASDSYAAPAIHSSGIRRDVGKLLRSISPKETQRAASLLKNFSRPALLVWSEEDRHFPIAHAEQLCRILPKGKLVRIDDSYTFVPEDQPELLAEVIAEFMRATKLTGLHQAAAA